MIGIVITLALALAVDAELCCIPQQWEGVQGNILANVDPAAAEPVMVTSSYMISYDAINRRVATIASSSSKDGSMSSGMILDYAAGIQYTVQGANCTRTTLGAFHESCIPSDATVTGNTYYGSVHRVDVTAYAYKVGNFQVYATMTKDTCAPVQEVLYGSYSNQGVEYALMQTVGYSNITPGIKNPSVFTPPSFCNNVPIIHAVTGM